MSDPWRLLGAALALGLCTSVALAAQVEGTSLPCNYRRVGGTPDFVLKIPDFPKACYRQARWRLQRAAIAGSDLSEARMEIRAIHELAEQSPYVWTARAELALREEELGVSDSPTAAVRYAMRAVRARPPIPEAYVALANAQLRLGCIECASRAVGLAGAIAPDDPNVLFARAKVLVHSDTPQASDLFTRALRSMPAGQPRAVALIERGDTLLAHGDVEAAGQAYRAASEEAPQLLRAQIRHAAFLLYERGDADAAIAAARTANRVQQTVQARQVLDIAGYLRWAQAYERTGRTSDLRETVQRATLSPEEVFVIAAGQPKLVTITEALARSGTVKSVDSRDGAGHTALMLAAGRGNVALVRQLLKRGAQVNAETSAGQRALGFAVRGGHPEIVEILLARGADVDTPTNDGDSPLGMAVAWRRGSMVAMLLSRGANLDSSERWTPGRLLRAACSNGDLAAVKALVNAGVSVNAHSTDEPPPLIVSILSGSAPVVSYLLSVGADPDVRWAGENARGYAREMGLLPVIERAIRKAA